MKHFLIVFDRRAGQILRLEEMTSAQEALRERFAVERKHRGETDLEVVVLGADSEAALRRTHARYFENLASLVRRVADPANQLPRPA